MTVSHEQQDQDWRARAACRDEDPELFFPVSENGHRAQRDITAAKEVCARCPVVEACLAEALSLGEAYGIRGGLTAEERRGRGAAERAARAAREQRFDEQDRRVRSVRAEPLSQDKIRGGGRGRTRRKPVVVGRR